DSGRSPIDRAFPSPLCSKGGERRGGHKVTLLDRRDFHGGGEEVIHKGAVQKLAVLVVDVLFIEGDTQTLDYSSLHHPLDNAWVKNRATVVYGDIFENTDLAGLGVHLYHRYVGGSSGGGIGVQAPLRIGQPLRRRQPTAVCLQRTSRRDLTQRDGSLRRAYDTHTSFLPL